MKLFDDRTADKRTLIREAIDHAAGGDLALHVWQPPPQGWSRAPQVFLREAAAGQPWGHLMGVDRVTLTETARQLGVRCVFIHCNHRRLPHGELRLPHVDLCGGPLRKAIKLCSKGNLFDG